MISAVSQAPSQPCSTSLTCDLAIVGGGIVGLTVAAVLGQQDLSVVIVEQQSQSQAAAKNQAYALHLSSQKIYEQIGIWPGLEPQLQPFTQVKLSDADYPYVVNYQACDLNAETVGYVGTHQAILTTLQTYLSQCSNLHYLCPYKVQELTTTSHGATIDLTNPAGQRLTLNTSLVIAADGSQSPLRQRFGIEQTGWAYDQCCVVATLEFEQPQAPIAYERFWPTGPLGVLPLSEHQYRIVWTLPTRKAEQVLQLTDTEFVQALHPHLDPAMGAFTILGPRFQFPTKLRQSQAYVQPRFALVGDAAHTCHPVGGQGLNLGIRDAAALGAVILQAWQRNEDIGSLRVLKRYQRWRLWQNWLTLGFTDVLNRMFSNQAWGVVGLRRFLLHVLGRVPILRQLSLRFMAGLWGEHPGPGHKNGHF